ncbi:MAG: conjugal transfer protein TraF [Planctomycetes bacterium]|nr:conjugal transfer protein TraF [Planctomycetota bacterium]
MKGRRILLAVVVALLPLVAGAEEWVVMGARARGMGGAGVATSSGAMSGYWNPSLLGFGQQAKMGITARDIDFSDADQWSLGLPLLNVELSAQGGLLADADKLQDLNKAIDFSTSQSKLNGGTALTAQQVGDLFRLVETINKLDQPGKGAVGNLGSGVALNIANLGFSALTISHTGIEPIVDFSVTGGVALSADTGPALTNALKSLNNGSLPAPATANVTDQTGFSTTQTTLANDLGGILAAAGITIGSGGTTLTGLEAANFLVRQIPPDVNIADPALQGALKSVATATANNQQKSETGSTSTGSAPTIDGNGSGVRVNGLVLKEIFVTYSAPVVPKVLGVGFNFKVLDGLTFDKVFTVKELKEGNKQAEELRNELEDNITETSFSDPGFTVDLGATLQPVPWFRAGWVGRNMIPVRFQFEKDPLKPNAPDKADYEVNSQQRVGVAWQPHNRITLAGDYDLHVNDSSALPGYESRVVGGGAELVVFRNFLLGLALRAGAYENLEPADEGLNYTGGLGIRIWKLEIEAAGAVSKERQEVETDAPNAATGVAAKTEEIPQRLAGSVSLGFNVTF